MLRVDAKAKTIVSMENKAWKAFPRKLEPAKISNVRIIIDGIRRTAEYASDIAEIVLNLT